MSVLTELRARAAELEFLACGITDPTPPPHATELDAWLARGYAGTMRYMHRQARRRKDPRLIVPGALSIVVLLDNYYSPDQPSDLEPPRIAKYARGDDYHLVTAGRVEALAALLVQRGAAVARSFVDAGPVPERELAQRAGLGWIGKNTMLLRPGVGSYFFIASIFTDLRLPPDDPFTGDYCGDCTRCLDACPTAALVEPRVLDATRCISYLTIEQREPIPASLLPHLAGYAFGCDICNDVCPWNQRFATPSPVPEFRPRGWLAGVDPESFDRMDDQEFSRRYARSALQRPGLAGIRRNLHAVCDSKETEPRP